MRIDERWGRARPLSVYLLMAAVSSCGLSTQTISSRTASATSASANAVASPQPAPSPAPLSPSTGAALTFDHDVNPILQRSCSGAQCHDAGSPSKAFVDNQANFDGDRSLVMQLITASDANLAMPPASSGKTLADQDRQTLEAYLEAEGVAAPSPSVSINPSPVPTPIVKPPSSIGSSVCPPLSDADKTAALALSFTTVNTIASNSCGGAGCHTGPLPHGFVGSQTGMLSPDYAPGIVTNLMSGAMPIGGRTISSSDKTTMINYICTHVNI